MNEAKFVDWLEQHYAHTSDGWVCRRCDQLVGYATKHAAIRHGDPIEIIPPSSTARAEIIDRW